MKISLSRRNLLQTGALGLAGLALPRQALAQGAPPQGGTRPAMPRNIIFMVSDGMSAGVPTMADHYLQISEGKGSFWRSLMMDPQVVHGYQDTRSLSSLVTDSAAASSSWGSGQHVWNGMINMYPDGTKLRMLYDLLGEAKMRRGLVSTATITHATPAGFAVHVNQRNDEEQIAEAYLDAGIEVLLGGGHRFFGADKRKDQKDLYAAFGAKGYAVVRDRTALEATQKSAPTGKLLGIFSDSHIPYAVDRKHDATLGSVPSLEDMTRAAIAQLRGAPEGFILQVEAARVDHAAHSNDAAGVLLDQLEFDRAVQVAVEFARQDGETLVVITSDHGNSNPGLNGSGSGYFNATAGLKTLAGMKCSYEVILKNFAATVDSKPMVESTVAGVQSVMEENLGLKLTPDEAQLVSDALTGSSALKKVKQYQTVGSALAIALGNHSHIGWTGRQHTNDYTVVTALGPGAAAFGGLNQNTSFFGKLLTARGLKWQNPSMTFEAAQQALMRRRTAALDSAVRNHWV